MDAVSSTGVATGLGLLIGAMLPIVPPPGPGDLLTPAILGGLMANKITSTKKRKPNPAIGDPADLLADFEREVGRFAELEPIARELANLVRQTEKEFSSEPKVWTAYNTLASSRYEDMIRVAGWVQANGGIYSRLKAHGRPLFLAIHQQLALSPTVAKKVDAASRYWAKASLRFTAPSWAKSLRHVSYTQWFGAILAYEVLLKTFRAQIVLAKEAISGGVSHDAESSKTTLQAGPFRLVNTGRFTDEQMQNVAAVVKEAARLLTDIGLARVCYGDVLMSRKISRDNVLAFYMAQHDEMFVRGDVPDSDSDSLLETVIHELGHRLQFKFLNRAANEEIDTVYSVAKRLKKQRSSDAHFFPRPGTKIETPVGEVTFLGHQGLGIVSYLGPNGESRVAKSDAWKASMEAWDHHYGRDAYFISHYASGTAFENFAELVRFVTLGKAAPVFVDQLVSILKLGNIELNLPAPRKQNPVTLSPTKAEWPGKSRGVALSSLPKRELKRGIEHEREHIGNRYVAQRIAADHLVEDPAYYTHLDAMERQQNPVGHAALSLAEIKRWEHLAASSGVSEVARSRRGFLTAYKRAGGNLARLSEFWRAKREAFIARHMAQASGEAMFVDGLPTRRHLALIMWAYSPDASRLKKASPRKANPASAKKFRFRGRTDHEVPCSLCGTTDKKVTVWLSPIDADGNEVGEAEPYGRQCAAMLLRGGTGKPSPSQAEAILVNAASEAARADMDAWHARVRPHAVVVSGYYILPEDAERVRSGTMSAAQAAMRLQERFPKPRKANPVDNDATLALLKEAAGDSAKVKWREVDSAREFMIVAHGKDEVLRIAATIGHHGALTEHDFYASPEDGYRALHLRLPSGEPVQVKTARMATLAYAAQGVSADGQVDTDAFRKLCDLASYADEGDAHAARRFDEIPVTELRSQITR